MGGSSIMKRILHEIFYKNIYNEHMRCLLRISHFIHDLTHGCPSKNQLSPLQPMVSYLFKIRPTGWTGLGWTRPIPLGALVKGYMTDIFI
jgi:hypothetical protein